MGRIAARAARFVMLGPALAGALGLSCNTPVAVPDGSSTPVTGSPSAPSASPASSTSSAPALLASAPPPAAPAPDAGSATDAGTDASAPVATSAEIDWKNTQKPEPDGEALQARARSLFEAVVADDPSLGDAFWFPREPFTPLKDVKGADSYWMTLHKAYAKDIHVLHGKQKSWDGAAFERFEMGSTPKWVKPGEEANKIGYYRSFRGQIRYSLDGKSSSFEVRVMITWQGRWYITHLSKFKK